MNKVTFKLKAGALGRMNDAIAKRLDNDDKEIYRRTKAATHLIWRTAHAKRPMMTKAQARAHGSRVSLTDPLYTRRGYDSSVKPENEAFSMVGVPVRTGALQASIVEKVRRDGMMKYTGTVETRGIRYAGYIEYGTRKMAARPFMRPAINMNKEAIKRAYGLNIGLSVT